jgi:hypothetical protein
MFCLQVIAVIAFVGACHAVDHAYSSQSISHHNYQHEEPKVVKQLVVPALVKVAPVAHYVQERQESYQGHHESHHQPAISSFHIERHDFPAHPPADFHKYDVRNIIVIYYFPYFIWQPIWRCSFYIRLIVARWIPSQ